MREITLKEGHGERDRQTDRQTEKRQRESYKAGNRVLLDIFCADLVRMNLRNAMDGCLDVCNDMYCDHRRSLRGGAWGG
jgi:hypothetical protein